MTTSRCQQFRILHQAGLFVMPNPHDVGSTRLLTALGFPALATTSSGMASTLGRMDMKVTRDELVDHVARMTAATPLPFNVDSERLFADDLAGVAETVALLSEAGAAGCSIEDWNPVTGSIDELPISVARVAAAANAAAAAGMVLTARCEHHIRGVDDFEATIARLCAYRDAGAEVVYAPGLTNLGQIGNVVSEVGVAVNVLALPGGPTVEALAAIGVRRISTGGYLANVANAAVIRAARQLLDDGIVTDSAVDRAVVRAAFDG